MSNATQPAERWLPIPGYEGHYEVSDLARVRSLDRLSIDGKLLRGRQMSVVLDQASDGRYQVQLSKDGRYRTWRVYLLVLMAFVGPRPEDYEACHNSGDPTDNRLSNLRWDTKSANARDKIKHGTDHNARKTHCPRSHLLVDPNLVPSIKAIGRRKCLACARALGNTKRASERGQFLDFKSTADAHYARIMEESP